MVKLADDDEHFSSFSFQIMTNQIMQDLLVESGGKLSVRCHRSDVTVSHSDVCKCIPSGLLSVLWKTVAKNLQIFVFEDVLNISRWA